MLSFKYLQKILPRLYSVLPFFLNPRTAFPPAHAFFEVTYRCNLRCDMCHFLEIIEDTENNKTYRNELSTEEIKRAIDALPRFTLITFTGGEAFMKRDFMEILRHAASRHKVHVITNGTLFTESVVDQLMDIRLRSVFGSGLFYVGVSLEGDEELHDRVTTIPGSFRKTRTGLERLVQARKSMGSRFPLIHLTCVIGYDNLMDLVPLYNYAEKLGVNVCNYVLNNPSTYWHGKNYDQDHFLRKPTPEVEEIDPVDLKGQLDLLIRKSKSYNSGLRFSPNHVTPEEIVRYYSNRSSYKDYRCYIPWTKVAVSGYGDVFSCPHFRMGSVHEGKDPMDWNSGRAKEFRELLKKEKIFPGCLGCCQSEYVGQQDDTRVMIGSEIFAKQPERIEKKMAVVK